MDKKQAIEIIETHSDDISSSSLLGQALNMAIEALKAQLSQQGTTKDAISRQQALDAVGKYASVWMEYADAMSKDEIAQIALNNAKSTMIRILKELPTIQPEPQWILCSEKMPEEYGNYLISIHGESEPDIGTINPNDKRGWSLCDANGFHWASDKKLIVTAWMPLPSPYQKGATT